MRATTTTESTSRRARPALLALPLLLVSFSLLAPAPAEAAGMLLADGGFGGQLTIEEHSVRVTIDNGIAVTSVNQVFRNQENRAVEALYVFPVPKGASVANFSMWIGGKEMVGEVLEKEKAREIYNSYKRVNRDPGLLEQNDYKTFEMRIFPIAANAEQRVEITYYQELDFDDDWATYVYPLATVSRPDARAQVEGRFALGLEVLSEVPIAEMASPSHRGDFVMVAHTPDFYEASLETAGGALNRDVVVSYRVSRAQTGLDLVTSKPPGEDGYFLLTLTVGEELPKTAAGTDYVFVLDISGSMGREGKLELSQDALGSFVRNLDDGDRFEMIAFNVTSRTLFSRLSEVDGSSRRQAERFLASQQARGGTKLQSALNAAYRYKDSGRTLNVVILSDGMTEQQDRGVLLELIGQRPQGTRVFSIGVGNEVHRAMLEQLAEETGGLAAFLSPEDDLERAARAFHRKLQHPVAEGVEIAFEGTGVYDLEPQKLGNLYHGAPLRLYGRYRQGGPVTVRLSADVQGRPLADSIAIELPEGESGNPEIERMWAWHRVQRLLKEADRAGSRDQVIDEIVRLGEAFSIVTEYTSFLVLENDAEYRRWQIERRNALRIERDRAQQARLRSELERLRGKAEAELGPQPIEEMRKALPATPAQQQQVAQRQPGQPQQQRRGWDLDLGGGGALDPWMVALVALLLGGVLVARQRV